MFPTKTTLVLATAAALMSTCTAGWWDPPVGTITLYEHKDFGGVSTDISIRFFGSCVRVPDIMDDRASSADWVSTQPDKNILIVFYEGLSCNLGRKGESRSWLYYDGFPSNFRADGINDMVSSVMLMPPRGTVLRGIHNRLGLYYCKAAVRVGTSAAGRGHHLSRAQPERPGLAVQAPVATITLI